MVDTFFKHPDVSDRLLIPIKTHHRNHLKIIHVFNKNTLSFYIHRRHNKWVSPYMAEFDDALSKCKLKDIDVPITFFWLNKNFFEKAKPIFSEQIPYDPAQIHLNRIKILYRWITQHTMHAKMERTNKPLPSFVPRIFYKVNIENTILKFVNDFLLKSIPPVPIIKRFRMDFNDAFLLTCVIDGIDCLSYKPLAASYGLTEGSCNQFFMLLYLNGKTVLKTEPINNIDYPCPEMLELENYIKLTAKKVDENFLTLLLQKILIRIPIYIEFTEKLERIIHHPFMNKKIYSGKYLHNAVDEKIITNIFKNRFEENHYLQSPSPQHLAQIMTNKVENLVNQPSST